MRLSEFPFTDVVVCGGDGMAFLYIQSIWKSKYVDYFENIPVCFLPGGSHNGFASEFHGGVANHAVTNFLWGKTVSKELLWTTDVLWNTSYVGLMMSTGITSKIVTTA